MGSELSSEDVVGFTRQGAAGCTEWSLTRELQAHLKTCNRCRCWSQKATGPKQEIPVVIQMEGGPIHNPKMMLGILLFMQRAMQPTGWVPSKVVIHEISVLKILSGCSVRNELRGDDSGHREVVRRPGHLPKSRRVVAGRRTAAGMRGDKWIWEIFRMDMAERQKACTACPLASSLQKWMDEGAVYYNGEL